MPKWRDMTTAKFTLVALLFTAAALAQNPPELKSAPGFSLGNIDRSAKRAWQQSIKITAGR